MAKHAQRFWSEREEYHALAEEYERNIEITRNVTSDPRRTPRCWNATAVTYYEYRGETLK